MAHDDPNLYVVRKKPKRAIPGSKTEKATEVQQRVGQENLTTPNPGPQAANQRPPPALLKMAAMIWKKSANRPEGQFTKQQAFQVAKKVWMQRQAAGQNPAAMGRGRGGPAGRGMPAGARGMPAGGRGMPAGRGRGGPGVGRGRGGFGGQRAAGAQK